MIYSAQCAHQAALTEQAIKDEADSRAAAEEARKLLAKKIAAAEALAK